MVDVFDITIMAFSAVGLLVTLLAFAWTLPGVRRLVRHQVYKYKVWRWGDGRFN